MQPRLDQLDQQLLVEGNDDRHIVWQLCLQHRLPQVFTVELPGRATESGGISELLRDVPARLKLPGLRTLGILADADFDQHARWAALRSALSDDLRAIMPQSPVADGWVHEGEDIRIGIWLMPNNQTVGVLEDFALQLIPGGDALLPQARAALQGIEAAGLRRNSPNHRAKALIHTWLAWQREPGHPMGLAIQVGDLKYNAAPALAFVAWLRRLFALPAAPEVA